MPITFRTASHLAGPTAHTLESLRLEDLSAASIYQRSCPRQYKESGELLQSSFQNPPDSPRPEPFIVPCHNGFVDSVLEAYNHHHALVIRPDDVWLAIITQFNFYVNGNAEELRKQFVAHEGKKDLVITAQGNRYTVDFGEMAKQMTGLIAKNIVDPSLREWVLPDFTTTTLNDTIVSAVVMMAAMKHYFAYTFRTLCGIPRVTLQGTKGDWENILARLDKLNQYGEETIAWHKLLVPVISQFVRSFDDPDGQDNIDFWSKVAHYEGQGSGVRWLAGWITAFSVWNEQGKWLGNPPDQEGKQKLKQNELTRSGSSHRKQVEALIIDGVIYHRIDSSTLPCGYAEVDVTLDDNGESIDTLMTAGHVGKHIYDSGDKALSATGERDTVAPVAGWWIWTKRDVEDIPVSQESIRS